MEAQESAAEREARYKEREMELRRMELELEIKKIESPAYQRRQDDEGYLAAGGEVGNDDFHIPVPGRWEESLAGRTKRFGDTYYLLCLTKWQSCHNFSIRSKNFSTFIKSLEICRRNC